MGNEAKLTMDEAVGRIEDELKHIKSASEQVNGMIESNSRLSEGVAGLIASTEGAVKQANERMRIAVDDVERQAEALSGQVEAIGSVVDKTRAAIDGQTASAREAIGKAGDAALQKAADGIESLTAKSAESVEESLREARGGLDRSLEDLHAAKDALASAAGKADESCEALQRAAENAAQENSRLCEEAREALVQVQQHAAEIKESVEYVKGLDLDAMQRSIDELQASEAAHSEAIRKQQTFTLATAAVGVVLCIVILVKLLIM